MNKRVLIISPHFVPLNAADMHRVRMSLPYFKQFGWEAEVVTVDPKYSEITKDDLLLQSVPPDVIIHYVKAFNKSSTSKFGLGSLALRAHLFYRKKVNQILKEKKFDLVYFSTTEFAVCTLGAYWKKRFDIPYVIDMQDPWHSDYYKNKPKHQQPAKYWFSYRLNKYLEPIAIKEAGGLISVSANYINDLKTRYPEIKDIPSAVITFGAFKPDLKIAEANYSEFSQLLDPDFINVVYVGRGGSDMHHAVGILFKTFKKGLEFQNDLFKKIKLNFIGTSYAPSGQRKATILPLANEYGIGQNVVEITKRISYYHTLHILQQADALFIPGSDDPKYTASKLYAYLLTQKPLAAIFNQKSSIVKILNDCTQNVTLLTFPEGPAEQENMLYQTLSDWGKRILKPVTLTEDFEKYSAEDLTGEQTHLFDNTISHFKGQRAAVLIK